MPRKPNPLKGVSIEDLIDIDPDILRHLTKPEMRRVVSRMADAANKRLRRLNDAGFNRGRYYGEDSIAGVRKFSTRGLDLKGLQKEYARVRRFLESPTSTVRATKKKVRDTIKAADALFRELHQEDMMPDLPMDDLTYDDDEFIYPDPFAESYMRMYSDEEAWELSLQLFIRLRDDEMGSAFAGLNWDSNTQRGFAFAFIQGRRADTSVDEMLEDARRALRGMYESREEGGRDTLGGIPI